MVNYPNHSDRFGPSRSLWDLADAIRIDVVEWEPEYLAAYERQAGETAGTIKPIRRSDVRYRPFVRAEDVPPHLVVWTAGVKEHRETESRDVLATVEVGVLLVVGGATENGVAKLIGAHSAAVRDLLLQRRTARGRCRRLELADEDYTGIDAPSQGGVLASAALLYLAHDVHLGRRGTGPPKTESPRPDPTQPWPTDGVYETADATVAPTSDPLP